MRANKTNPMCFPLGAQDGPPAHRGRWGGTECRRQPEAQIKRSVCQLPLKSMVWIYGFG